MEPHLLAFIDILGFSNFVKDNQKTPDIVKTLLMNYISMTKSFTVTSGKGIDGLQLSIFSDNIAISAPYTNDTKNIATKLNFFDLINFIQSTSVTLYNTALPIRGSVVYGNLYHDEKNNVICGEALIDAYNLEREAAVYPHIVTNAEFFTPKDTFNAEQDAYRQHEVQKMGISFAPSESMEVSRRKYYVCDDCDGILFCNYLSSLRKPLKGWANYAKDSLTKHRDFIVSHLQGSNNIAIHKKYDWMKNYHNWFCEGVPDFVKYTIV